MDASSAAHKLLRVLGELTGAQRIEVLAYLRAFYCIGFIGGCGRPLKTDETCHCENDE